MNTKIIMKWGNRNPPNFICFLNMNVKIIDEWL